jgi:hypothetical protein
MSVVLPAATCFLILGSLGAIIIAHGLGEFQIPKYEMTVSVSPLESTDSRASEIRGYFPQMLNYQDFWHISSIVKILKLPEIYHHLNCDLI